MHMGLSKVREIAEDMEGRRAGAAVHEVSKTRTRLRGWTTTMEISIQHEEQKFKSIKIENEPGKYWEILYMIVKSCEGSEIYLLTSC